MSHSQSPKPHPSDLACPICSKPVLSGLVWFEHGQVSHVRCYGREVYLTTLTQVDRTRTQVDRTRTWLWTRRRRMYEAMFQGHGIGRLTPRRRLCPLCHRLATVVDWRSRAEWIAIESCSFV